MLRGLGARLPWERSREVGRTDPCRPGFRWTKRREPVARGRGSGFLRRGDLPTAAQGRSLGVPAAPAAPTLCAPPTPLCALRPPCAPRPAASGPRGPRQKRPTRSPWPRTHLPQVRVTPGVPGAERLPSELTVPDGATQLPACDALSEDGTRRRGETGGRVARGARGGSVPRASGGGGLRAVLKGAGVLQGDWRSACASGVTGDPGPPSHAAGRRPRGVHVRTRGSPEFTGRGRGPRERSRPSLRPGG